MADPNVNVHKLSNGMTLVAESMPEVSSAAFVFLVPAGAAGDPEGYIGTSAVLSDLLFRGAGEMDNRTLNNKLDYLGLQRSTGAGRLHCTFSGALVGSNLVPALELYADVIRQPALPADQFDLCSALALQELDSLNDDPRQRISLLSHEDFLPAPLGQPPCGRREDLQKLSHDLVKQRWADAFAPEGTILAVAGKVDFDALRLTVEKLFGSWQGTPRPHRTDGTTKTGMFHHPHDGAQVHVGVMYPSVTYKDSDYYAALAAVAVLSGGMGSRLFTEVREKRGLCYAVVAMQRVIGRFGAVQAYVGSSPEQAQEALDVMLAEFTKLADGISQNELDRAKVGLRATLVMLGEASTARAGACAGDMYHLGRVRSLTEIEDNINGLTVDDVVGYAQRHQPQDFCITTLGPKELTR